MPRTFRFFALILAALVIAQFGVGQTSAVSSTVVFEEAGFPTADTSAVSAATVLRALTDARAANAAQLPEALADAHTKLLVMPYGSAYPEAAWPAILKYVDRGGNLLVLGGKPFTRAAYRDGGAWKLRGPSVAESLELFIHDYQETPGSAELKFATNADVRAEIPAFAWTRGFSPVVRLSVTDRIPRDMGGTGNEDAWLTTIAWGERDGHKLAAPAFLIDHVAERFVGGRWIFLACDGAPGALENPQLLETLQKLALRRNDRFTLRPKMAVFLPGEPLAFDFAMAGHADAVSGDELRITTHADSGATQTFQFPAGAVTTLPLSVAEGTGLHAVEATLVRDGKPLWTYRTGFWMRDLAYLRSGPKLAVGRDYFELDGKPLPVVGTTYMSSDVDRMYLAEPNPYVWDEDMAQIRGAGLNMLRSGIWTQWKLLTNPDDTMSEHTLRSIEAFLMTARRHGLPVQFNLFAFVPDAFGGGHPYLSPEARARQDKYVASVVSRFHDVPFLAWDLINEPSANEHAWSSIPQANEDAAWRAWLKEKYPDQAALLAAWAEPSFGKGRALQAHPTAAPPEEKAQDPFALPPAGTFADDSVRSGYNPLKVYDYDLFTQSFFRDWVKHEAQTIRDAGSQQLITVGQDEGGVAGRVSPAFFSPEVSFTCTHAWWDFDSVLWAGLMAKMPAEPMLIQEMGEQRRLTMNDHLRLSAEEEAWQLERKLAISFAQGAGGIEWVWNVNAMMANDNEIPIGAVRPDGTEKPEVPVLSGMAHFAAQHPESFTGMTAPDVTVVMSQAMLYGHWNMATEMLKKSVRAGLLRSSAAAHAAGESHCGAGDTETGDTAQRAGADAGGVGAVAEVRGRRRPSAGYGAGAVRRALGEGGPAGRAGREGQNGDAGCAAVEHDASGPVTAAGHQLSIGCADCADGYPALCEWNECGEDCAWQGRDSLGLRSGGVGGRLRCGGEGVCVRDEAGRCCGGVPRDCAAVAGSAGVCDSAEGCGAVQLFFGAVCTAGRGH